MLWEKLNKPRKFLNKMEILFYILFTLIPIIPIVTKKNTDLFVKSLYKTIDSLKNELVSNSTIILLQAFSVCILVNILMLFIFQYKSQLYSNLLVLNGILVSIVVISMVCASLLLIICDGLGYFGSFAATNFDNFYLRMILYLILGIMMVTFTAYFISNIYSAKASIAQTIGIASKIYGDGDYLIFADILKILILCCKIIFTYCLMNYYNGISEPWSGNHKGSSKFGYYTGYYFKRATLEKYLVLHLFLTFVLDIDIHRFSTYLTNAICMCIGICKTIEMSRETEKFEKTNWGLIIIINTIKGFGFVVLSAFVNTTIFMLSWILSTLDNIIINSGQDASEDNSRRNRNSIGDFVIKMLWFFISTILRTILNALKWLADAYNSVMFVHLALYGSTNGTSEVGFRRRDILAFFDPLIDLLVFLFIGVANILSLFCLSLFKNNFNISDTFNSIFSSPIKTPLAAALILLQCYWFYNIYISAHYTAKYFMSAGGELSDVLDKYLEEKNHKNVSLEWNT